MGSWKSLLFLYLEPIMCFRLLWSQAIFVELKSAECRSNLATKLSNCFVVFQAFQKVSGSHLYQNSPGLHWGHRSALTCSVFTVPRLRTADWKTIPLDSSQTLTVWGPRKDYTQAQTRHCHVVRRVRWVTTLHCRILWYISSYRCLLRCHLKSAEIFSPFFISLHYWFKLLYR